MCSRILLLDALEVVLGDLDALGELEVVVEAVLDRRADRDLHARVELHHRGGEHVRGVVADEPERRRRRRLAVTISIAAPSASGASRSRSSPSTSHAERGPGKARADRAGGVGAGGAVGELERGAVGERDLHRGLHAIEQRARSAAARARAPRVTRKRSRTRSRPARPISTARPGSRTSSTRRAASLVGVVGEEAVHAVADREAQAAVGPPTTGVRFQSASQGARSKPSRSEQLERRAREMLERAHLEAAEALVAGEQQHVLLPVGEVGHLLRRAPVLRRARSSCAGQHQLELGLLGAGEPERLDGGVRVVPAVELA